ncbi:hypothetical protein Trco_003275 [Trichoderma cornu-damae]|uniref:Uncharacterized protein n=1 Tax=Trichoderma cornu-damae TaxID=654480 RepID=A0A9P8QRG1_9HYPO|nr:hypothetical protein Trco_003275 [Trichoderma cornu-damae]
MTASHRLVLRVEAGKLALQEACQSGGHHIHLLPRHQSHADVWLPPSGQERLLDLRFGRRLGAAAHQDGGDVVVASLFLRRDRGDAVIEARDQDSVAATFQLRQDRREVREGFVVDMGAVYARVRVGTRRVDADGGVEDAAQPVGQAGNLVVQPVTVGQQDVVDGADAFLVPLDHLLKPSGAKLLLPFDEEDDVVFQLLRLHQIRHGKQRGQDGAFVVADASPVEETIGPVDGKRFGCPLALLVVGRHHIVMPVEEDSLSFVGRLLLPREPCQDDGIVRFPGAEHFNISAHALKQCAEIRGPLAAVLCKLGPGRYGLVRDKLGQGGEEHVVFGLASRAEFGFPLVLDVPHANVVVVGSRDVILFVLPLGSVQVPQLNNAVELAGIEKGPVQRQGQHRLRIVRTKGHDLPDAGALGIVRVASARRAEAPKLDCAVPASRDQHVVLRANLHRRPLCDEHAVDVPVVGKLADRATVDFQDGVGSGDQPPLVLAPPRGACSTNRFRVEESMASPVGMPLGLGGDPYARIAQADPLYGHVLRADVERVVLRAVRRGEDVADIVVAVDLVEAAERLRTPHVDDGVAGAREQVAAVGREGQRHDAPLMRLDLLHLVEGGERPDDDFAILSAGIDGVVLGADREGEDAAAMLEAVKQLRLGL